MYLQRIGGHYIVTGRKGLSRPRLTSFSFDENEWQGARDRAYKTAILWEEEGFDVEIHLQRTDLIYTTPDNVKAERGDG